MSLVFLIPNSPLHTLSLIPFEILIFSKQLAVAKSTASLTDLMTFVPISPSPLD